MKARNWSLLLIVCTVILWIIPIMGAKKVANDYSKYLLVINDPNWVKMYGDGQESQLYYTVVVLKNIDIQQNVVIQKLDTRIVTLERQILYFSVIPLKTEPNEP